MPILAPKHKASAILSSSTPVCSRPCRLVGIQITPFDTDCAPNIYDVGDGGGGSLVWKGQALANTGSVYLEIPHIQLEYGLYVGGTITSANVIVYYS